MDRHFYTPHPFPSPSARRARSPPRSEKPLPADHLARVIPQPSLRLKLAPLTRENLKKLNDELPPHLKTPSSKMSASTLTDPAEVWAQLRRNHIYDNDKRGETVGAKIISDAKAIINKSRKSSMLDEELDDFADVLKEYGTSGETTFLIHLWEVLLKKNRKKRMDLTDEEWLTTAWAKDGLRSNWQEHFAAKWVPQLESYGDPHLVWLYENVPKVKTPWPDITYGYTHSSCGFDITAVADRFEAVLCKEMHFPFWFIEAKSADQPYAAATHQKPRAGATANHQLLEIDRLMATAVGAYLKAHKQPGPPAGESSKSKPSSTSKEKASTKTYRHVDEDAVVFALSISPQLAEISVHFTEQRDAKTMHYHMHTIGAYLFSRKADVRDLRKHIDNILDWGLTARKAMLEKKFACFHRQIGVAKKRKVSDDGDEDGERDGQESGEEDIVER
ncbi:MAG: hypothetical protein Q9216_004593 [Gyalolechia sp. 2 TL-2023]